MGMANRRRSTVPLLARQALTERLPPSGPTDLLAQIRERVAAGGRTVVVLDDDPTGTQTVHGVPVLTGWSVPVLEAELRQETACFYLLTNSRSLPPMAAEALNREIGTNLTEAARRSGRDFIVISRSDSTLRGHFPGEVDALAAAIPGPFDAWLLIPFFEEGGRFTAGNIHYVAEGEWLVPAGETSYARDEAFGYRASDLREWVAEKSAGRWSVSEIVSLSLEEIRQGPETVSRRLRTIPPGGIGVVNAVCYRDLELFVLGLLESEGQGRRYLYRTAASFVRVRAGLAPRDLLAPDELQLPQIGAGLFIVGSYVPQTTRQVAALCALGGTHCVEVHVARLLDPNQRAGEIHRAAAAAEEGLRSGQETVIMTSRELLRGGDAEQALHTGRLISESLIAILGKIKSRPRYLVAKGGITASDVATAGLGVQRAWVLGQLLPGVPVWRLGQESRYPGLTYIVFPGNVGDEQALATIARSLRRPKEGVYARSYG
jgi:uncharacterized protein YgbK (DUF1537 family)